MTDDDRKPEDREIAKGFDLPADDATPPPGGTGENVTPRDFDLPDESVTPPPLMTAAGQPAGIEPHVKAVEARAEKHGSVWGKLIALLVIPVIAVALILMRRHQQQEPWIEYRGECVSAATAFMKGMSDDTETSVPAAYDLLYADLREGPNGRAVESVQDDYKAAASGKGAFKSLESVNWGSDESNAFSAEAQFDKGTAPVRFSFVRVKVGDKMAVRITEYSLGRK